MEMVKQHMRVIGEKMSEIFNNKQAYPEKDRWPNNLNQDEDERAITSNLNSIDILGYTNDDYWVNDGLNEYVLKCCPKPAEWNRSGNKCFAVHAHRDLSQRAPPGVVFEIDQWDGTGAEMVQDGAMEGLGALDTLLGDANKSREEKIEILVNTLTYDALHSSWYQNMLCQTASPYCNPQALSGYVSRFAILDSSKLDTFNSLIPEVFAQLEQNGIHAVYEQTTPAYMNSLTWIAAYGYEASYNDFLTSAQITNPANFNIGYKLDDPVDGNGGDAVTEYNARSTGTSALAMYWQDSSYPGPNGL